jgi:hypothetical protein
VITATIIVGSIAFALVYTCVWLCVPRLRRQIEQPKFWFLDQVHRYDRQCARRESRTTDTGATDMRTADTRQADTRQADTRPADTRAPDARPADARPADTRPPDTSTESQHAD